MVVFQKLIMHLFKVDYLIYDRVTYSAASKRVVTKTCAIALAAHFPETDTGVVGEFPQSPGGGGSVVCRRIERVDFLE
jgi:hypothetical protein